MKKHKSFILILLSVFFHGQQLDYLRNKMLQYYSEGKIETAYSLIENVADKNKSISDLWLYKMHFKSIIDGKFTGSRILNDSLGIEKRNFNVGILRSSGIYNTKENRFLIPPVYQNLYPMATNLDYLEAVSNGKYGIIDLNNNVILPFNFNEIATFVDDYFIVTDDNYKQNLYDYKMNNLFKDYYEFSKMDNLANFFLAYKSKKQVQLIDMKSLKILEQGNSIEIKILSHFKPTIQEAFFGKTIDRKSNIILLKIKKENKTLLYSISDSEGLHYLNSYDDILLDGNNLNKIINTYEAAKHPENKYKESKHYLIIKEKNKYGVYCVEDNQIYIQPSFKNIDINGNGLKNRQFSNIIFPFPVTSIDYGTQGIRKNFLIYSEKGKQGIINFKGEKIFPAEYDKIISGNSKDNILYLCKNFLWGYANLDAGLIKEPSYDLINMNYTSENLRWTYKNKKYFNKDFGKKDSMQVFSTKGLFTIDTRENFPEPQIDKSESKNISSNKNGIFRDAKYHTDSDYYNEKDNDKKFIKREPRYSSYYYHTVNNGKKYGLKVYTDYNDKISEYGEAFPLLYDSIKYLGGNLFLASINGKYGLIDDQYRCLLNFEYDEIDFRYIYDIKSAYIMVKKNKKYALLNENMNFLLPNDFDNIRMSYHQMYGATKKSKNYFFLSRDTKIPSNFNMFEHTEREYSLYQYHKKTGIISFSYIENGKKGLVDYDENNLINPIYEDALLLSKSDNKSYFLVKKKTDHFLADQDGKILLSDDILHNIYEPKDINVYKKDTWNNFIILQRAGDQLEGVYDLDKRKLVIPFKYHEINQLYSDDSENKFVTAYQKKSPENTYSDNCLIDLKHGKIILGPVSSSIYSANEDYFSFGYQIITKDKKVISDSDSSPGIRLNNQPQNKNVIFIE